MNIEVYILIRIEINCFSQKVLLIIILQIYNFSGQRRLNVYCRSFNVHWSTSSCDITIGAYWDWPLRTDHRQTQNHPLHRRSGTRDFVNDWKLKEKRKQKLVGWKWNAVVRKWWVKVLFDFHENRPRKKWNLPPTIRIFY